MINTLQISEKLRKLQICENYLQYIWEFFRCKVILVICPNAGSAELIGMTEQANAFCRLNEKADTLCGADIRQVKDCGKFSMVSFNAGQKKAHHEKQIPIDLERARQMGAKFAAVCAGSVTVR